MPGEETPTVKGPSVRGTYGVLVGVGMAVLAVGLLVPFVVADPATDLAVAAPANPVLGASGAGAGAGATGTTATTLPGGTAGTVPGGGPAPPGPTGAGGAPAASGGAAPGAGADVERVASDTGITADTIVVGITVPDTSAFGDVEGGAQFGEAIGDHEAQYQAAIDEINERGGIGGRRLEAVYRDYAAGDYDAMRAACVYLTEEAQVFAILGGFYGDPILCITEQHETPLVALASEPDDYYARSQGRYFSVAPSKDRVLRYLVDSLERDTLLQGRTIGILDQEGVDAIPVDRTLIPELERRGYRIAYHARIANDVGAAQSQIPLEVQRMRDSGVDSIIVASGLIRATVFVQEAENQRYQPAYLLSDFASGATDVYTVAMPQSFETATAYTSFRTGEARVGRPEAPHDAACRANYEARTGDILDPAGIEYFYAVSACGIAKLFERGLAGAGPNPTRVSFSESMQRLGPIEVPYGNAGSFGAGKFDAPDSSRRVGWEYDCRCWLPAGEFRAWGG